jgi:hypothetical protein
MEVIVKTIMTLVIMVPAFLTVVWLWRTQIDPCQTVKNLFKKNTNPSIEWVATREPNRLYQNGIPVADITGDIVVKNNLIVFKELCNSELKWDDPIQYGRKTLTILSVDSIVGQVVSLNGTQTTMKQKVWTNVECKVILEK